MPMMEIEHGACTKAGAMEDNHHDDATPKFELEVERKTKENSPDCDKNESDDLTFLDLSKQSLTSDTFVLPRQPLSAIFHLDLSRNSLDELPLCIIHDLPLLSTLNLNRNRLKGLPAEIGRLTQLTELHVLSNHLRLGRIPINELANLSYLQLLDVRYNSKLSTVQAQKTLREGLQERVNVRYTLPDKNNDRNNTKLSACDRDATDLQAQLEPLSTPQLRKRLYRTFAIELPEDDESSFDRQHVMQQLLHAYASHGPRTIRQEHGIPISKERIHALRAELDALPWPQTTRERPKIAADYYMILQLEGSGVATSVRTQREAAKRQKYQSLLDVALATLHDIDPEFHCTAIAVTYNFTGSPHIDTLNVGPFYGLSLGEFSEGGGKIAVECSATEVAHVDTRYQLAKVDGRFPHWVTPYTGTRYSLIYYVTSGPVVPHTTAIFELPHQYRRADGPPWIPPPMFEP